MTRAGRPQKAHLASFIGTTNPRRLEVDIFERYASVGRVVEAFQRWHDLSADGVVGDDTWNAGRDGAGNSLEARVGLHHTGKSG
jgi:Putative peptidoglycan binding domain